MIRLVFVVVLLFLVWILYRMVTKQATLEQARTIGLQEAENHIQSPILLEDYIAAKRIPIERIEALIESGDMPSYRWRQYTFIENRELVPIEK